MKTLQEGNGWIIRGGTNVSLWVHKWINNFNLEGSLIHGPLSCGKYKLNVKDIIYANGEWNVARLSFQFSGTIKGYIIVILRRQFVGYHDIRDCLGYPKCIPSVAVVHQSIKQTRYLYHESLKGKWD